MSALDYYENGRPKWCLASPENAALADETFELIEAYMKAHPDLDESDDFPRNFNNAELQLNKDKAIAFRDWLKDALETGKRITFQDTVAKFGDEIIMVG